VPEFEYWFFDKRRKGRAALARVSNTPQKTAAVFPFRYPNTVSLKFLVLRVRNWFFNPGQNPI
jgi:hypothetical protein